MVNCEASTANVSSQGELIESLLQAPPPGINLHADVIDGIINDEELVACLMHIEDGKYLDGFIPSLDWWLRIARLLLDFDTTERSGLERVQELDVFSLSDKLKSVTKLFAAAFIAPSLIGAIGSDPSGLVLVRQYHNLKLLIGNYASVVWPDERWEKVIAEG